MGTDSDTQEKESGVTLEITVTYGEKSLVSSRDYHIRLFSQYFCTFSWGIRYLFLWCITQPTDWTIFRVKQEVAEMKMTMSKLVSSLATPLECVYRPQLPMSQCLFSRIFVLSPFFVWYVLLECLFRLVPVMTYISTFAVYCDRRESIVYFPSSGLSPCYKLWGLTRYSVCSVCYAQCMCCYSCFERLPQTSNEIIIAVLLRGWCHFYLNSIIIEVR